MKPITTPSAMAAISAKAVANGGNNPPIVTPTPTEEQLSGLATELVAKNKVIPNAASHTTQSDYHLKDKSVLCLPQTKRPAFIQTPPPPPRSFKTFQVVNQSLHDAKHESSSGEPSTRTSHSAHPPLISRYCGCCGDLLSTRPYGLDNDGRDRANGSAAVASMDRTALLHAAQTIQQRLQSSKSSKSSKATKAGRKKKKLEARNVALYMQVGPHQQEYAKQLEPWPEESLEMDMTILQGLMTLKNTPREEVACRCWRPVTSIKSVSPTTTSKAKKTKLAAKANTTKTKPVATKKKTLTKGAGSLTSTAGVTTEVVSTKTLIVKDPKTGKKIKKTVRVVKKLVKKKLKKNMPGVVGTAVTTKNPSTTTTPIAKTKIPSFSALGAKPESPQHPAKNKKRAHPDGSSEDDDEDDDHSEDGGSLLKKRRRNDEKADLELRERLMNCPLENGPLFPSQQELMELTTIRKRNALQTFYKRFNELRQFIAIFGDANVPQQFPENHSLGIWVNKMRMERKKWDTGSERTSLTERKIELLESIDFIWAQNHKGEIGWERRFQEIRKFKRKHGHCNVPTKSAENRALGRWVSTQRTMYKNYMKGFVGKSLTREEQERRIFLLLKEGFLFSMIPNGQSPNGTGEAQAGEEGTSSTTILATNVASATAPQAKPIIMDSAKSTPAITADKTTTSSSSSSSPSTTTAPVKPATISTALNSSETISPSETKKDTSGSKPNIQVSNLSSKKLASTDSKATPLQTTEELSNGDDRVTVASSQSPVPPCIAQVSVTTTPTTTPSVSTVASPDRSSSGDEPDCETSKTATIAQQDKKEDERGKSTAKEMPVAPLLQSRPVTNRDNDAQTNLPEASDATMEANSLTKISVKENNTPATPVALKKSSPAKEKSNTSPPKDVTKCAKKESSNANAGNASKAPPVHSKLLSNESTNQPVLMTSEGLRIIVKISESPGDDADLSPSSRKPTLEIASPSPSRRSGRARKPSARQLEAEKSPLRESILGR